MANIASEAHAKGCQAGQVEQVPSAGPVGPAAPGRQGGSTDHLSGGQRERSGSQGVDRSLKRLSGSRGWSGTGGTEG
ncbi:hypothetical protein SKAU_G00209180 [Synaphobranchus kaupii]|uniref:Uncharacterized protein n=1 Tax=Synaphobranchus kaupii TaxID=118154 RepID=A0A9Q1F8I0_SYNKA|nr:hypothetical protein SKAU_G00209180 [Synaphobranchus kaupii]